jgi:hypothetical protein
MARSVESRLREIETAVGEALVSEDRRCFSFTQIVQMAQHLVELRRTAPDAPAPASDEEWAAIVGEPELVPADGELSPAELIQETILAARARERASTT